MTNHFYLGRLKQETLDVLRSLVCVDPNNKNYHWINFTVEQRKIYSALFNNPLSDKISASQKVLVSPKNSGFRIHKDEPETKSVLNLVLQCNKTDWVRWYNTQHIRKTSKVVDVSTMINGYPMKGRNVENYDYENVDYVDELSNQEDGDVYIVNAKDFHSFKCIGDRTRLIIQTKFVHCPTAEDLFQDTYGKVFQGHLM